MSAGSLATLFSGAIEAWVALVALSLLYLLIKGWLYRAKVRLRIDWLIIRAFFVAISLVAIYQTATDSTLIDFGGDVTRLLLVFALVMWCLDLISGLKSQLDSDIKYRKKRLPNR